MSLDPTTQDVVIEVDEETAVLVGDEVRLGVEVVSTLVPAPTVVEVPAPVTAAVIETPAFVAPVVIEVPTLPIPEIEAPAQSAVLIEVPVAQGIPGPEGPVGPEGPAGSDLDYIPDLTLLFENALI